MLILGLVLQCAAFSADLDLWLDEEPLGSTFPSLHLRDLEPPTCGQGLLDAVQLPPQPQLYSRYDVTRQWGTRYAVDALVGVAEYMQVQVPGADPLWIGDLSRERGGPLPGHKTHDTGQDVDIGFYVDNARQIGFKQVPSSRLDVETTWTLIEALLATDRVEFILLDQSIIRTLRTWLLDHRVLSEDEILRVFPPADAPRRWEMDGIVIHAPDHADHLHVHFRCSSWSPDA